MNASTERFLHVTELAGEEISTEQFDRLCHRYYWAGGLCRDRDVLEVACGSGPGLRYLAYRARSLKAGDYSPEVLARVEDEARRACDVRAFDAQAMPYDDASLDVVIIFEALYYIPEVERFIAEANRILRPNGVLLIASANKDLYDFNPSPHSHTYHGVVELGGLLKDRRIPAVILRLFAHRPSLLTAEVVATREGGGGQAQSHALDDDGQAHSEAACVRNAGQDAGIDR